MSVPGVTIEPGRGGLEHVRIERPEARAEIYAQGATVTSWQPEGHAPVIFLSSASAFRADKAIRGGIPICFPWFGPKAGDPKAPQHGFARTSAWRIEGVTEDPIRRTVTVELALSSSDATRALWPFAFEARYRVTVGAKLELELAVENRSERSLKYEVALHTYHAVSDPERVRIRGLAGAEYIDKVDGMRRKIEQAAEVALSGETDRLYLGTDSACEIDDPGERRRISIAKDGSRSTVLWNPWSEKAATLKDLGEGEWRRFVCVEIANAGSDAIELAPGQRHSMRAQVVVNSV